MLTWSFLDYRSTHPGNLDTLDTFLELKNAESASAVVKNKQKYSKDLPLWTRKNGFIQ